MAVLTFWAGLAGVKVEFITENEWTTKLQNQTYSLVLKTNNASRALTQVYSQSTIYHTAKARWRRTYWSGMAPGAIWVDYNLPYMTYSKAIPNYDTSITLNSVGICDELYMNGSGTCSGASSSGTRNSTSWYASDQGTTLFGESGNAAGNTAYGGQCRKDMGAVGGPGGEFGLMSRWDARYLYGMNSGVAHARELYLPLAGNGEKVGEAPYHYRELDGTRYFDSAHTVSAFGKPVSIDARPQFSTWYPTTSGSGAADVLTYIGAVDNGGWGGLQADISCNRPIQGDGTTPCVGSVTTASEHWQFDPWVAYLIVGDWYLLTEIQQSAAWEVASFQGTTAWNTYQSGGRHVDWGIGPQSRNLAWFTRVLFHAYLYSPDSTPEKAYFKQKLDNNLAVEEGVLNLTTGNFYQACSPGVFNGATESSKWCWGLKQRNGTSPAFNLEVNPLHFPYTALNNDTPDNTCFLDLSVTEGAVKPWMHNYVQVVYGHMAELYSNAVPAQQLMVQSAINVSGSVANGWNPWINDVYTAPGPMTSTGLYATTWANYLTAYLNTNTTVCGLPTDNGLNPRSFTQLTNYTGKSVGTTANGFDMDYEIMERAAVSFGLTVTTPEGNNGLTVYNWIKNTQMAAYSLEPGYAINPKWAIVPRSSAGTLPTITTTSPLTSGTVGVAYSLQFAASGDTPITWTYDAVPGGVTLTSGGLLSGTPTTAGTSTINVTATNGAGSAGPIGFSLAIGGAGVHSQATGRMTGTIK
jgi:hypothetical protein